MDEDHLTAAIRHVSLNPVRARLVERSPRIGRGRARAHLAGRDDGVVTVAPVLKRVGRFAVFADKGADFAPRASCGDGPCGQSARKAG